MKLIGQAHKDGMFPFFSPWPGFALIAAKSGNQEISNRPFWISAFLGCTGISAKPASGHELNFMANQESGNEAILYCECL